MKQFLFNCTHKWWSKNTLTNVELNGWVFPLCKDQILLLQCFSILVTNRSSLHCSCTPLADLVAPVWQHYTPVRSSPCDHPSCRRSRPLKQLHWWCSPGVPLTMASFSLHCRSGDPWLFFAKILVVKYLQKNSNFNFLRVVGLKIVCNFIKVMLIFF